MTALNFELISDFRELLFSPPNPEVVWNGFGRRLAGVLETVHDRPEPDIIRAIAGAFRPPGNPDRFPLVLSDYHRAYLSSKYHAPVRFAELEVWVINYHQIPFSSLHAKPSAREFADIGFLTIYDLNGLIEYLANFAQIKRVRNGGRFEVELGQFLVYKCDTNITLGKRFSGGPATPLNLNSYPRIGEYRFYWTIAEDLGSVNVFRRISAGPALLVTAPFSGYLPQLWPLFRESISYLSLFFTLHGVDRMLLAKGVSTDCDTSSSGTSKLNLAGNVNEAAQSRIASEKFLDELLLMAHGVHGKLVDDLAAQAEVVESELLRRMEGHDRPFPILVTKVRVSAEEH